MHRLYGFPDGLADTFALNTHLHIEERQFGSVFSFIDGNDGTAHTLTILADGFVSFGTSQSLGQAPGACGINSNSISKIWKYE